MNALAIFVHGAEAAMIFLAVFALILLVTALCSWLIVRWLRPRIGKRAYLAAMVPFAALALLILGVYWWQRPNAGPPRVVPASKIAGYKKRLPDYIQFSLTGAAFYSGKLYVGTNFGLAEIVNGKPEKLYQFQSMGSVVSGPWLDAANNLLWAMDEGTNELVRFNGSTWTRVPMPVPAKGYYSRSDVGEGIRPAGNERGFWMATAGSAWQWDAAHATWVMIGAIVPDHKNYKPDAVIGVLPIQTTPLLLTRHEALSFLIRPDEDFASDEVATTQSPLAALPRDGKPFLADTWAVDRDAGYICTKDQRLMRVTLEKVAPLEAPGPCETVVTGNDFSVLVSVRSKGIFRYADGQWSQVAPAVYPSGAGEYWTYLATAPGQMAVVVDAKPVVDHERSEGANMQFTQNAPTTLWVWEDGAFVSVVF